MNYDTYENRLEKRKITMHMSDMFAYFMNFGAQNGSGKLENHTVKKWENEMKEESV